MNAAEIFRLSVTERLEAVAKEFFLLFHRSVAQYEEEIERQRRLLDVAWKPYIKLHRIDFHQPHVYEEEEEQQEEEVEEKEQDELLKETQEKVEDFGEQHLWDHRDQGRNHEVKRNHLVMQEEQKVVQEYDAQLKEVDSKKHHEQLEEEEYDRLVGEKHPLDHWHQERNHKMKPEPPVMVEEQRQQQVKQEGEEQDAPLKEVDDKKHHAQLEEDGEILGKQQLWDIWHQGRNHEVKPEPPRMQELQQVKQEVGVYDVVNGAKQPNQLEEEKVMDALVEQQLWDDWNEWMNPEVKPEPPAMGEKELQEVKQESDDVPVSCSLQLQLHERNEDRPGFWNPDGRVDTLAELAPAAEGHQHQPPTGPAGQAAGLKDLYLGPTAGNASLQIPKQLTHKVPGPTTQEKTHICTVCSTAYSSENHLADHRKRLHRDEMPFKCQPCGKTFRTPGYLMNHSRIHRFTTCTHPGCGKVFLKNKFLKKHMIVHAEEKPHQCNTCERRFKTSCYLKVHMRTHTGEKPYSCKTCGRSFAAKMNLNIHIKSHTGEKPYSCETCGKGFAAKGGLNKHMKTHTGEKPYSCETCGKSFAAKTNLIIHIRTHTGEKPYSCETCGKSFACKMRLKIHMRTHTGEKPYSCETCGKSFASKMSLKIHMRTHTGEKPYSCKKCGKRFATKMSLNIHMRTHTGEKPYSCKKCGKSFAAKMSLNNHMRTHTGEKSNSCETCGKSFTTKMRLDTHIRTHTGEKPYECK